MDYEQYYKATKALKPPESLSLLEKVEWLKVETDKIKATLPKAVLLRILKDEKDWQAKVDSALKD